MNRENPEVSMENFQLNETTGSKEIAWSITFVISGIMVIVINSLALYTFIITTSLRTRKHVMIINLTVTDLLFGAVGMPSIVLFILKPSEVAYYAFFILNTFSKMASLLTLGAIAVERMHATLWPIRHRVLGNNIYRVAIAVIWFLSAVVIAIVAFGVAGHAIITTIPLPIVIVVVITTIVTCYVIIWISVRRSGK